jgi:hypothetical protein
MSSLPQVKDRLSGNNYPMDYLDLACSSDAVLANNRQTIWHGIKGFRNSPYGERRIGALTAIKMRAPVLGGNFGMASTLTNYAMACAMWID